VDADGENIHVRHLAELRRWVEPLGLPRGGATFHLLEGIEIGAAIIEFARANKVEQLVMGVPTSGEIRAGSLPAQIKADAPCPVTFVRAHAIA
jgi:nucleotide-binding universal stress UspA family protein